MLTFLFWNLKKARPDILASLARTHGVDVIMLAECPVQPAHVLESLNRDAARYFYVPGECPKVKIYTKFSGDYVSTLKEAADYSIRRLMLPGRLDFLLCMVHFPSKLRQIPVDQTAYAFKFGETLASVEEDANHTRTILVGDLNMNPYEDGLVVSSALHAVPTRAIAAREKRTVNKFESNLFFYNPMWKHFGERSEGHAGTYYYRSPKARADFWNIYDQVLLRPEVLPYFQDEDLAIIHEDVANNLSLLRDGIPDQEQVSDHLPILFQLQV